MIATGTTAVIANLATAVIREMRDPLPATIEERSFLLGALPAEMTTTALSLALTAIAPVPAKSSRFAPTGHPHPAFPKGPGFPTVIVRAASGAGTMAPTDSLEVVAEVDVAELVVVAGSNQEPHTAAIS